MAVTALERKRQQRERDKLTEVMARLGIEEPQDVLTRLIHGASRLDDESLQELTEL